MSLHLLITHAVFLLAVLYADQTCAQSPAVKTTQLYAALVDWTGQGQAQAIERALKKQPWREMAPDARDFLLLTAIERQQPQTLRVLLDWGLSPSRALMFEVQGELTNITPLQLAVSGQSPKALVDLLLARVADPNLASDGQLPLHTALSLGRLDLAQRLLDGGADPRINSGPGNFSPLHELATGGIHADPAHLDAMVSRLVKSGVAVNARDKRGATALHFAATNQRLDLVRALLAQHADPSLTTERKETALQIAQRRGHREIVRELELAAAR